ncbi:MAG: hypothetical protein U0Y68_08435 [Blastocatellia bacterium]
MLFTIDHSSTVSSCAGPEMPSKESVLLGHVCQKLHRKFDKITEGSSTPANIKISKAPVSIDSEGAKRNALEGII